MQNSAINNEARKFVDILLDKIESDPNLTVSGLALASGLDNSTIRQMIKNRRSPRLDTAMKICDALNTTVESFLSERSNPLQSELLALTKQLTEDDFRLLVAAAKGLIDNNAPPPKG